MEDLYRRHLRPEATDQQLRRATGIGILGLVILTWFLCIPQRTTLAALLYFTGAFVASTIWPVAAGLYWRRTNPTGATTAMVLGSAVGLYSYFAMGFYVVALVSERLHVNGYRTSKHLALASGF